MKHKIQKYVTVYVGDHECIKDLVSRVTQTEKCSSFQVMKNKYFWDNFRLYPKQKKCKLKITIEYNDPKEIN